MKKKNDYKNIAEFFSSDTHVKIIVLLFSIVLLISTEGNAQFKETVQFATLTPTAILLTQDGIQEDFKIHFAVSTTLYLATYTITESQWKAALITLALGAAKEIVYDELLNQGDPRFDAMGWNTLGVAQGVLFTFSLKL